MRIAGRFLLVSLLACAAAPIFADEVFLESDDYKEAEEPVGVFLKDDDYARMVEDIERNDTTFDWGWVKTPGYGEPAPIQPAAEKKGFFKRRSGGSKTVQEPRELAFDIRSFGTIYIPPIENYSGIMTEETRKQIHEAFVQGAGVMSLQVVPERSAAALALEIAAVDQMRTQADVPVYGIRIKPFVLLEFRLVDVRTGEKLMLIRNRKHGTDVPEAAFNFADDWVKFLR